MQVNQEKGEINATMRWDEDRTGFREVSVKKVDVKASQDGGSQ